jgi:uncharacterized protein (DUF433 family)
MEHYSGLFIVLTLTIAVFGFWCAGELGAGFVQRDLSSKSDTIYDAHYSSGQAMIAHLDRISIDPNVCFGQPCIRGTRIWVSLILDFLAEGLSEQQILEEYPQLKREDILAALAYGAEMAREHVIPIATENAA